MDRNEQICEMYLSGLTLRDIKAKLGISHERVRQILRDRGIYGRHRPVNVSDRDEFLGVNLSEADKTALREEAKRRGVSMSALTADLIKEMLEGAK